MNDDELLAALGEALEPPERTPPADRLAAVRAQAAAGRSAGVPTAGDAGPGDRPSRRTVLVGTVAAAVGAAAGVAATIAAGVGDEGDATAAPPTQPVEFSAVAAGATATGRTIDHTWGMELLLDVDGLPVDRDYLVTYETAAGAVAAGGFRSVAVPMACRFNGTALRDAVTAVVVADGATGDVVLRGRPA